jgi:hypothetical protein
MHKYRHENIVKIIAKYIPAVAGQVGFLCELADLGALNDHLAEDKNLVSGQC